MAIRFLVPDGKHLPVTGEDGKPDHHLMGAAWAALHGGYRGNKYDGPDKAQAVAALKKLYEEEKMDHPSEAEQCEQSFRVQSACRVLQSADAEGKAWDVEITTIGPSKSRRLDWPKEVLQRDAGQFNHVPSYKDHAYQHSVDDLIGHIENPRMGDGALIGTLQVLNPEVWAPKLRAIQAMPAGIAGMSLDCLVECEPPTRPQDDNSPWVTRGKQAYGDAKPLKVKRVVKAQSVDLVSPPDAGGRILRAVASQTGHIDWQDVQDSELQGVESPTAEQDPTARAKGGTSMKEKIQRILQAIKRFDAARAGTLEAEIAPMDEEKQFDRVTQVMLEIEVPKPAAATTTTTTTQAGLSDADRATLKAGEETARQLRVTQAALHLNEKLSESRLPKPLRDKIAKQFQGREFTDQELDGEITEVRQTYAALMPQNRISAESVAVGLQSEDKLGIAMDKLWGVTHENKFEYSDRGALRVKQGAAHPGNDIPGFRGIREAYIAYTGDTDCSGDPQAMRRVTQMESTAAFPLALANTLNRLLVREYAQVDFFWQNIVSQITAPMDFRTQERVRTGYFSDLSSVTEDAPYTEVSTITDEQATYSVGTFGNTLPITRRAIINDDIGLMKANVRLLGRAAARTLARQIWTQLISNSTYGPDSLNIFHANHNNTGTSAFDSVSDAITALNAVQTAMYGQTEKDSGEVLALRLKYLAVPIQLEPEAKQLNNSQFTVDGNNVRSDNPWYNYFGRADGSTQPSGILTIPLFADPNDWYAFADPNQVDTIEVGFLQGRQAPEFFLADNPLVGSMFTQDRIVYKVRFEFGTTVLDYRGMYKQVVM
jgi:hypothetical protein